MKRISLISALLLASAATSAVAAPQLPKFGHFTQADLQRAQIEAAAQPLGSPGSFEVTAPQLEGYDPITGANLTPQAVFSRNPDGDQILLADDDDTAHYMRGRTLAIHIFINHTGGTWDGTEMGAAGAKGQVAKDHYTSHAPFNANVSWDWPGGNGYWFYVATVPYNIPNSGMTGAIMEDALASLGFGDGDGDGTRVDDFTLYLQTFDGSYDNVLACFEPDVAGRAFASYGSAKTALYTDSNGNVWAHEWGHLFGACDEYTEGGQCNGGIDCGLCQSWYLDENINNGNCQLAICAPHESCIMINNTFAAICPFTLEHWGWVDEGNPFAGLLDLVKRRTSGNNFVNIYELFHNGWFFWDNTTQSEVLSQRWTSWNVVGIRPGAGADEDITLYGDNNHNYIRASSAFGGSAVDFVVGDYNHTPPSNEHIQLTHFAGPVTGYNLTFEGGNEVLYPDGVVRAGGWADYNIVRVWDVPLFAGEEITFFLDNQTAGLDLSMALYKSNGAAYWVGRSGAVMTANLNGNGLDESFTYTVPADDVYGLVVWSNNAVAGNFTIQIGPDPVTLAEETPFYSAFDLRLFNYIPTTNYWAIIGTRPDAGNDMDINLFSDANYINELESSTFGGNVVDFIAVDYNHASITQDYLRVWRFAGAGNHRTEWEQDPETGLGLVSETHIGTHLGKVWDVLLTAGQNYFFREYHSFASPLDNGLYLFGSTDGDYYKPRAAYDAGSNFRPPADGGEWFNFTPPLSDWYGLVNMVNDDSGDSYSILSGPDIALAEDGMVTRGEQVVFGSSVVPDVYWTAFGARPSPGDNVLAQLYGDDAYTINTLAVSNTGPAVSYVVADFNHVPTGTVYPRFFRSTGFGAVDIEWEGGADQLLFTAGGLNTYDLAWPAGDVVEAYDILVPAGRTIRIRLDDLSGVMDLGLELFDSNGAPYYAAQGGGVSYSDASGVGGPEQVTFANPTLDWLGVVVFNKNDLGGNYRLRVGDGVVAVNDGAPASFGLRAGRNPSSGDAPLNFSLAQEGPAEVAIFDLQGRKVRSVADGHFSAGTHKTSWDGKDDAGNTLSAGVYVARLQSGGKVETVKLVRSR